MINASDFDPVSLPLAVFVALIAVLALQVRPSLCGRVGYMPLLSALAVTKSAPRCR
jgi:hypothetical protein